MTERDYKEMRRIYSRLDTTEKELTEINNLCDRSEYFDILGLNDRFDKILGQLRQMELMINSNIPKNILVVHGKDLDNQTLRMAAIRAVAQRMFGYEAKLITLNGEDFSYRYWDHPVAFVRMLNDVDILIFGDDVVEKDEMVKSLVEIVVASFKPHVYQYSDGELIAMEGNSADERVGEEDPRPDR